MMIAAHSFLKSEACQQRTQVLEANIGIGCPAKDLLEDLLPHLLIL